VLLVCIGLLLKNVAPPDAVCTSARGDGCTPIGSMRQLKTRWTTRTEIEAIFGETLVGAIGVRLERRVGDHVQRARASRIYCNIHSWDALGAPRRVDGGAN
jgi:hypothetical protein